MLGNHPAHRMEERVGLKSLFFPEMDFVDHRQASLMRKVKSFCPDSVPLKD